MKHHWMRVRALGLAALLGVVGMSGAHAAPPRPYNLKCTMDFSLKGWSAFYSTSQGSGTIHCSNGKKMKVKLSTRGGGLTAGKTSMTGRATFTEVQRIDDLLGSYASVQAQAGAVNAAQAQVLSKGEVSLTLTGKGKGWSLGVAASEFRIER